MRGLLAIAVLLAGAVSPLRLGAQVASVLHPFAPDATQQVRGSPPLPTLPDTTRAWTLPVGPVGRPLLGSRRPFRPHPRFGFGIPASPHFSFTTVFWSPMFYPYLWDSSGGWDSTQTQQTAPSKREENHALARQMGRLTREITKLRYYEEFSNQGARAEATPAPSAVASPAPFVQKLLPTVFVYRDGRLFQATDFAIFGKALWIFEGQTARKIPLATLDLAASKKLNDERGVRFVLPD